ncbi:hypothetical protein LXL04_014012 [Taraxacum kok-saghyz]
MEKVYVAIGNDVQEGFATLEWTLRKWSSSPISIVILHADINRDYVYTYYGKLPASYVNDESVDLLNKYQQGKLNKILQQYIDFCGEVKTETLNIEKYDEPIHTRILQLISGLRICKLVMGATFFKSFSSGKFGNLVMGLKKLQQKKPDFCEFYLISGGKLFFLKEENNEGFIEDDQGMTIAKLNKKRGSFKGWIGKMYPKNTRDSSSSSSSSADSPSIWERSTEEIEEYFNQLLNSNEDEEESETGQASNAIFENNEFTELIIPHDLNPRQKTGFLRVKISEARDAIHLKRREAKESARRYSKAEWAINLCNSRVEDIEARLNEEATHRGDIEKELETVEEQLTETRNGIEHNKSKLDCTLEIQRELSNKLKSSTLSKSQSEEQLTKLIHKRGDMIQEIEKLRKQKDVMRRRIEFCRDKDAIETITRLNHLSFFYKEFTSDEIKSGTEHFSENFRVKCSGDFTNVYRARINQTTVAVKVYEVSEAEFGSNVKALIRLQHPHLVAMLGFCTELKCIVFEYMHGSSLRNVLFSNSRKKQALNWHSRVCIAAEVCSGLTFLHLSKPNPIVHGNLNVFNILLDRNNVAKLHGFRLHSSYNEFEIRSDIKDFGSLVLQLLTGRNWCGLPDEVNEAAVMEVFDQRDGEWPLQVAMELARIAIMCSGGFTGMTMVMTEMEEVRKKADDVAAEVGCTVSGFNVDLDEEIVVPSFFFCPILQDIMRDPHVASDGFSYEFSAIERWIGMGHNTSPLTNLELEHKRLTPNLTLRSLIQDWHNKRSISIT